MAQNKHVKLKPETAIRLNKARVKILQAEPQLSTTTDNDVIDRALKHFLGGEQ